MSAAIFRLWVCELLLLFIDYAVIGKIDRHFVAFGNRIPRGTNFACAARDYCSKCRSISLQF